MMDIQKEKNLYLAELLEREVIKKDEFDDIVFKTEINAFHSCYLSARFMDNINFGWSAWQAAKSQAVPEGFVLVPHDVAERCMGHISIAMCHPNNSNAENDVMQMDLDILESKVEAQEQSQ